MIKNIFRNFRVQITVRVILISASLYTFFFLLLEKKLYATTIIVGLLTLHLITSLIRYAEKTNRLLVRFLNSIRYSDFSQSFSSAGLGSTFKDLNRAFADVMNDFQRYRSEKEEHYRYLQTVVQHIGIGIIVFRRDGSVDMVNNAAKRMLKVARLRNIRSLSSFSQELTDTLFQLKAGEKALLKVGTLDDIQQLAIYATEFRLQDQEFTMVSIQNILRELEEKEMEAWQNMIRVLTHEIMNSITPISSLASTVMGMLDTTLEDSRDGKLDPEAVEDIQSALGTIHKRSQGLMDFVTSYRNLTLIPKPQFKIVRVKELFNRINDLLGPKFKHSGITFHMDVDPETLELTADPNLVEQVIINLLINSFHGLQDTEDPKVSMICRMDELGRVLIVVEDNGAGIVKEALEKIFIPFYTTKKEGSGIGLSLSKQIMRLHDGTIRAHSIPNQQTVFTLRF